MKNAFLTLAAPMLLLLLHPMAAQQQIELVGGSSSLYQSQGGTAILRGKDYEGSLGAGLVDGQFVAGARILYRHATEIYSAGIEQLQLGMPTDLFNQEHRLQGIGLDLRSIRAGMQSEIFLGATSTRFDTPLFQGARPRQPTAAVLLGKTLSPTVRLHTDFLSGKSTTFLQGVEWSPWQMLDLAASAGVSGGSLYGALSTQYRHPRLELKTAYILAGRNFVRVGSEPDLVPEPVGFNALVTLRSSSQPRVTLSAGCQNTIVVSPAELSATPAPSNAVVDQLSATASLERIGFTGALLHSTYLQLGDLAYTLSAKRSLSRSMDLQASYYESHLIAATGPQPPSRLLVGTLRDTLSNHFSLTGNINRSGAQSGNQTTVNFGGALELSSLTVSAGYQTFYLPTQPWKPFQQSLILDLQMTLFGRVTLHAGTFVSPTGKLLYTIDARSVRTLMAGPVVPMQHARLGSALLKGRVLDSGGRAIIGAAIQIEDTVLYTDSTGTFFLREKKPALHHYTILFDQFMDGRSYRVVSAPMQLGSTKAFPIPATIIVSTADDAPAGASLVPEQPSTEPPL